jgi:pimeloyl-ACP methyl ester carboxylesterase
MTRDSSLEGGEMEPGDASFKSFDGVRLAYSVLPAHEGRSPLPPVVLHHGFASDSRTNWLRPGVAEAIAVAGHDVVVFDARGHGSSEKPREPAAYRSDALTSDVEALARHLALERFDLVGYSLGAFVAMGVALTGFGARRLVKLVLAGAGAGQESISSRERAEAIASGLEADDAATIADPTARAFRNFADATKADRLALAALQRARPAPPPVEALARIRTPTLVVVGERDSMVGERDTLARAIPGARHVVVPGDHLSAPTKPEFAEAIVAFLSE